MTTKSVVTLTVSARGTIGSVRSSLIFSEFPYAWVKVRLPHDESAEKSTESRLIRSRRTLVGVLQPLQLPWDVPVGPRGGVLTFFISSEGCHAARSRFQSRPPRRLHAHR